MKKKKILLLGGAVLLVLLIVLAAICFFVMKGKSGQDGGGLPTGAGGGFSGSFVSASGVTTIGMTSDDFEVENLETNLYIEEVYVSTNSEIEAGTKILKISEESLSEAREELEETLSDADLKYRAGVIQYEQSKITAKYEYDLTVLEGSQAKEVYEETLSQLQEKKDTALETLTETREKIAEYQAALENDTYAEEYPYEELKTLYDENLKLLQDKMAEWNVTFDQITGNGPGGSDTVMVLKELYKVLEQNLADYEEAEEKYNEAVSDANLQLQLLQLNLSTLEAEYAQTVADVEAQKIDAKLTYETALASAEQAERDYETALQKAEAEYEELLSAKEDAEENLQLFEESIGDGYFYAASSGTVIMSSYRAGSYLQCDSMVIAYSNNEEVSVTVSVNQTNIAAIAVGDSAYVQISGYDQFTGLVTAINPVSDSDSRTDVTYEVTVGLEGDVSSLSANLTATVIFGELAEMESPEGMEKPEGIEMPEGMEKPEGIEMPEGMEAPEGMEMPEGMERPEGMESPEGMEKPEGMESSEGMEAPEGMEKPDGMEIPEGMQMPTAAGQGTEEAGNE